VVPVRVDGFREMLLHKQLPGKLFRRCSLRLHPPLDLAAFYSAPFAKEEGRAVVDRLTEILKDPD
jgi:1-acyl-sn-glycerol-3-phosphate acyltransferase